jgi:hypothetical protein
MKIRSGALAGGRRGGAAAAGTVRSAAGFLAGVACALLLAWWHQRHAQALVAATSGRGGDASAAAGQGGGQPAALRLPAVVLPNLDSLPYLMVSFGNAAYFDLAYNWARSVQAIGDPFLIAGRADLLCARRCHSPRVSIVSHTPSSTPGCLAAAGLTTHAACTCPSRPAPACSRVVFACIPACTFPCTCATPPRLQRLMMR